ncbi:MAG TPA: aminoacyl-histidine dipeptidase, partial [Firmicutes bacterium]|nr:aminoacyl-histidine dipeptidase [Bacillota bacterium]
PEFKNFYKLSIKGLKGGHSGSDIDKERGNALKILGRVLYDLKNHIEIGEIAGGGKDNAIPRESWVLLSADDTTNISDAVNTWNDTLRRELRLSDPDIQVTIVKVSSCNQVYDGKTKEKIISLINMIPCGPLSRDLEHNLVVSSNNLGGILADDDTSEIKFVGLSRSSVKSLLHALIAAAEQIAALLEIKVTINALYPGWEYAVDSRIRTLFLKTYEELYGIKGKVDVIHAGLECGILLEKISGVDAISLGPNIIDIHTPNEHISISSTGRTFKLLCEVLKQLK